MGQHYYSGSGKKTLAWKTDKGRTGVVRDRNVVTHPRKVVRKGASAYVRPHPKKQD